MSTITRVDTMNGKKLRDGMIKSRKTRAGDLIIAAFIFIAMLLCLLPMVHVLACSLSSADALVRNDVFLWPKGWNIEAYKTVLTTHKYVWSLEWTAILTIICTLLSITLTICCAYPLIYDNLRGGKFINFIILFTMYFSAGTIPNYILLNNLGFLNTPWCMILPNCISVFNVIIMRSFFFGVPDSLREAAEIDGAGPIRVLIKVYLPLSLPVIATLSLFYAVGRWNGFSDALMYLKSSKAEKYYPIQLMLYNVIKNSTQTTEQVAQEGFFDNGVSKTIQMATVMFATVPILIVYPWLQRYFVTGVTIGAVKG
ncbi:MAG: carbohydrate ABC transporter permease [Clostridia bacterium]|nr:carbohydrate ABC transporter permease [Clostridia bacterium]